MPRPPQPICAQLSLVLGAGAANRLKRGKLKLKAPAAKPARLRNERRFTKVLLSAHATERNNEHDSINPKRARHSTPGSPGRDTPHFRLHVELCYGKRAAILVSLCAFPR